MVTMPEQDCRAQRRIMVVIVISLGQSSEGFRVDPILNVGAIDADQDNGAATLDGDLRGWTEWNIRHCDFFGRGSDAWVALVSSRGWGIQRGQTCEAAKCASQKISPFRRKGSIHFRSPVMRFPAP